MSIFIHNELCCKYTRISIIEYKMIFLNNTGSTLLLTTLYRPGGHKDAKYEADKKTGTGGVLHNALTKWKARSTTYFYTFRTLKTFSLFFEHQ